MFSSSLLDFRLPLALLFAREAALLALRPALKARGLSEARFRLLRALTLAGKPVTQAEAARRAGLTLQNVRKLATGLEGYVAWERGRRTFSRRYLGLTSWGARQAKQIAYVAARHAAAERMPADWAALAERPEEARFPERARAALLPLLVKLQRAAEGAAVLEGANDAEAGDDDLLLGLPLQLLKTRHALLARIRRPLRAHGLNEVKWRILRLLAEDPRAGWHGTALRTRGCFHAGTSVSPTLRALKRAKLVTAHGPDTPTRRGKSRKRRLAQIGHAGRAKVAEVERAIEADCADLFERLDGDEMELLARLLDRLTIAILWRRQLHVLRKPQADHPFAAEYERQSGKYTPRDKVRGARRRSWLYRSGKLTRTRPFSRWHEAR